RGLGVRTGQRDRRRGPARTGDLLGHARRRSATGLRRARPPLRSLVRARKPRARQGPVVPDRRSGSGVPEGRPAGGDRARSRAGRVPGRPSLGAYADPFIAEWPHNDYAVLGRVRIESDGQHATIDVPRARFDVTTTVHGELPPTDWMPWLGEDGAPLLPFWTFEGASGALLLVDACPWAPSTPQCVAHVSGWIVPDEYTST